MSFRPICDVWILARPKVKFYGAYPNGFLERALPMVGASEHDRVLHLCGGTRACRGWRHCRGVCDDFCAAAGPEHWSHVHVVRKLRTLQRTPRRRQVSA